MRPPDAWGQTLINATLGRRADEIDYLIMAADLTRQGALRFRDEDGVFLSDKTRALPRLADLPELRRLAYAWETELATRKEIIAQLQGYVSSLGGARPKSNLDDDGVLSIIKFTSQHDKAPVERAEVATLHLAGRAGIKCGPRPYRDWITPTSRLLSLPASTGTAGSAFPTSLPEPSWDGKSRILSTTLILPT